MSDYAIANILAGVVVVSMMSSLLLFLNVVLMGGFMKHVGRWFLLSGALLALGLLLLPVVDRFWVASQL